MKTCLILAFATAVFSAPSYHGNHYGSQVSNTHQVYQSNYQHGNHYPYGTGSYVAHSELNLTKTQYIQKLTYYLTPAHYDVHKIQQYIPYDIDYAWVQDMCKYVDAHWIANMYWYCTQEQVYEFKNAYYTYIQTHHSVQQVKVWITNKWNQISGHYQTGHFTKRSDVGDDYYDEYDNEYVAPIKDVQSLSHYMEPQYYDQEQVYKYLGYYIDYEWVKQILKYIDSRAVADMYTYLTKSQIYSLRSDYYTYVKTYSLEQMKQWLGEYKMYCTYNAYFNGVWNYQDGCSAQYQNATYPVTHKKVDWERLVYYLTPAHYNQNKLYEYMGYKLDYKWAQDVYKHVPIYRFANVVATRTEIEVQTFKKEYYNYTKSHNDQETMDWICAY